jgi:dTDP-glucose 4,6-dehydratase
MSSPSTRPRAVVTGGAGFLGSHVCEALAADGHDVVCVDNGVTGSDANVAPCSTNPASSSSTPTSASGWTCRDASTSSCTWPRPRRRRTICGSRSRPCWSAARAPGTRWTWPAATAPGSCSASTSEVYGDPLVHPQPESYWGNVNPVGPRAVYDEAKRFAEALTTAYRTAYGLDTAIARIFNTYGTRMRPHDGRVVPNFVAQALAGEPLTVFGDGSQTRSLCHVSDTARGLLMLAASAIRAR